MNQGSSQKRKMYSSDDFIDALSRIDLDYVSSVLQSDSSWANMPLVMPNKARTLPLHHALKLGSAALAALLLQHNANVDATDDYGATPLHRARSREVALLLIAHGADVNSQCSDEGGSPLDYALDWNNLEVASVLIENGADVNATWYDEETAIFCAVCNDKPATVQFLIDHGANVNAKNVNGFTALSYARQAGSRIGIARLLLQSGADVNAMDNDGNTELFWACEQVELEKAQLLLDHGADINLDGQLALLRAAEHNHVEIICLLLNGGIDANCRTPTNPKPPVNSSSSQSTKTSKFELDPRKRYGNCTPLLLLCHHKEVSCPGIQLLLQKGADVNAVDADGCIPLTWACAAGNWNAVKILVHHGAHVNTLLRFDGNAPLSMKILVDKGVDVNTVMDLDGSTPLSMACMENEVEVIRLLLDAGAHVEYKNLDGSTSLLRSVKKGHVECAAVLLNRGANIHASDRQGDTPFLWACQSGALDMIYCMIRFSPHHRRPQLVVS